MTDPTARPDDANIPMRELRGTLILCDQVYQDRSGKFIIAGTYSLWQTRDDVLILPAIHAYLRIQAERPGSYPCRITMLDRVAAPQTRPLLDLSFTADLGERHLPVFEAAVHLPELRINAPLPFAEREPGSVHGLRTLVWLNVKGVEIASCPLDFLFVGPAAPNVPPTPPLSSPPPPTFPGPPTFPLPPQSPSF